MTEIQNQVRAWGHTTIEKVGHRGGPIDKIEEKFWSKSVRKFQNKNTANGEEFTDTWGSAEARYIRTILNNPSVSIVGMLYPNFCATKIQRAWKSYRPTPVIEIDNPLHDSFVKSADQYPLTLHHMDDNINAVVVDTIVSVIDQVCDGYESDTTQKFIDPASPGLRLELKSPEPVKVAKKRAPRKVKAPKVAKPKVKKVAKPKVASEPKARKVSPELAEKRVGKLLKNKSIQASGKEVNGKVLMNDTTMCEARIWCQIPGLKKPKGFKGKVSYSHMRCTRAKFEGCYCKLHNKQISEEKFWTGNIKEDPVECYPPGIKCPQIHTFIGFGSALDIELPEYEKVLQEDQACGEKEGNQ